MSNKHRNIIIKASKPWGDCLICDKPIIEGETIRIQDGEFTHENCYLKKYDNNLGGLNVNGLLESAAKSA